MIFKPLIIVLLFQLIQCSRYKDQFIMQNASLTLTDRETESDEEMKKIEENEQIKVNSTKDANVESKSTSERHLFPLQRLFGFHIFEGRGIKDFIGIVSTILAALLGAILVKLNALLVLSMVSIAIGKLLLLISAFKSHTHPHSNQWHSSPIIISEKKPIYYHEEETHHPSHIYRNDDYNTMMYYN